MWIWAVRSDPQKQPGYLYHFCQCETHAEKHSFHLFYSHFSYALYMITGVQKLAEHLHSTDENQATKVTPIAHCI